MQTRQPLDRVQHRGQAADPVAVLDPAAVARDFLQRRMMQDLLGAGGAFRRGAVRG